MRGVGVFIIFCIFSIAAMFSVRFSNFFFQFVVLELTVFIANTCLVLILYLYAIINKSFFQRKRWSTAKMRFGCFLEII
jgi:hypothetical protein